MTVTVTPTVRDVYHRKKTETKVDLSDSLVARSRQPARTHVLAHTGIEMKLDVDGPKTPDPPPCARHRGDLLRFVKKEVFCSHQSCLPYLYCRFTRRTWKYGLAVRMIDIHCFGTIACFQWKSRISKDRLSIPRFRDDDLYGLIF